MGYDRRIRQCLSCEFAQWVDGHHVCKADEARTEPRILAEQGLCPAGRFEWEGVGDFAAWAIHRLNLHLLSHWWRKLTGKVCGCANRQRRWNEWGRKAWGRLRAAAARVAHAPTRPRPSRRSSSGGSGS
jgi:hypothetical protein